MFKERCMYVTALHICIWNLHYWKFWLDWSSAYDRTTLCGLYGNSYFGFWRSGQCGRSFEKVSSYYSVFWVHHQKLMVVNFSISNLSFTSGISPTSSLVYDLYSKICEIFATWNRLQPFVSYFSLIFMSWGLGYCEHQWVIIGSCDSHQLHTVFVFFFFLYLGSCRKDLLYL